jgi:hypothetical protein
MSDTALELGRRIPRTARPYGAASPSLVRWTLRILTTLLFSAATAFGISLGMSAPEISPTPVVQADVAPPDL